MASDKEIKKRIKSVRSISQITKAMEAVSATKMRKSQEFALKARPYAAASLEMLKNLLTRTPNLPPLLTPREIKKSALLVITSDKGLAGSFNSSVIKKAEMWVEVKKKLNHGFDIIVVGKKGKDYFERRRIEIRTSYYGFGDFSKLEETLPVANEILEGFLNGTLDEVEAIYTNFRTTLRQEAVCKKILPVSKKGIEDAVAEILPESGRFAERKNGHDASRYFFEYKFEPTPEEILEMLVPQLLKMHIHHIILESNASEHSARMVAMKNASDNAKEATDSLNLIYNKLRQSSITRELTEITAGADALDK